MFNGRFHVKNVMFIYFFLPALFTHRMHVFPVAACWVFYYYYFNMDVFWVINDLHLIEEMCARSMGGEAHAGITFSLFSDTSLVFHRNCNPLCNDQPPPQLPPPPWL